MATTSLPHSRTSPMEKKSMKLNRSYDTENEDGDTNTSSNGKDTRLPKHRGNPKVHSPATEAHCKLTKNDITWFKTTNTNRMPTINNKFIKCYNILYKILYKLEEIQLNLENERNRTNTISLPFNPLKTIGKYW